MAETILHWRRAFPGFRIRLTRWGGWFLVLTLVLAFAAVNTGNNGLIAVVGAALGAYVIGGAWSREVLGHLEVRVRLPVETFAGRRTPIEVELTNTGRFFPAYAPILRAADGTLVLAEALLEPGERTVRTVEWCFERRGRTMLDPWRLEVVLPLGFFVKSKEVLRETEILVFPSPVPGPLGTTEIGEVDRGLERFSGRGREGDVFQLRDFRDGDDTRQVHWKQTARQRRIISVERRRRVDRPVIIHLDPVVSDPLDSVAVEAFERRVSAAAAAVLRRLERGEPVVLSIGETVFPEESRRVGARNLLEPLALVRPQGPRRGRRSRSGALS